MLSVFTCNKYKFSVIKMPYIQVNDRRKTIYKNTLFSGSGIPLFTRPSKIYEGGLIDFSTIANFVRDNKELISTGVSTAGKIIDLGKSVADLNKSTKEVEKIKELRTSKKPKKEYVISAAQEDKLKALGNGFVQVSKGPLLES